MKNNWVIKYKNIVGVALILLGLLFSGLVTGASGLVIYNM